MRFGERRYYIEAYVKCANCGVLVYDEGLRAEASDGRAALYCSPWCRDWARLRDEGEPRPALPLPRRGRAPADG